MTVAVDWDDPAETDGRGRMTAGEPLPDPTFEELSATIAEYDDPDDKLTIALGNFNRVRAERDAAYAAGWEAAMRQENPPEAK